MNTEPTQCASTVTPTRATRTQRHCPPLKQREASRSRTGLPRCARRLSLSPPRFSGYPTERNEEKALTPTRDDGWGVAPDPWTDRFNVPITDIDHPVVMECKSTMATLFFMQDCIQSPTAIDYNANALMASIFIDQFIRVAVPGDILGYDQDAFMQVCNAWDYFEHVGNLSSDQQQCREDMVRSFRDAFIVDEGIRVGV